MNAITNEFLVITDWQRTQHYKYRRPPWIKLHSSWLDDCVFRSLTRAEQGDFLKLLLIASKYDQGFIPNDRKYLREVGQIASKSIDQFIKLGLVQFRTESRMTDENKETEGSQENFASTSLALQKQDASPEGEGEKETETEAEAENEGETVNLTSRSGNCQSVGNLITGLNQLNKSIPSPSPETPGRRQSRKNGPFDDVKAAVEKLIVNGGVDATDIDQISRSADISPKQVKEAIKQLREDGRQY